MIERDITPRGFTDQKVLDAMLKVPRHLFVSEHHRMSAYEDHPLPIGEGQTISQPYMVAYMTEEVKPEKEDKVLEIGTGSGYQAAVLSEIVNEVYTLEIIQELGESAEKRFKELGYDNVHAKISDGYHGWSAYAPFDAIIVTAAAEEVPAPLIDQLIEGGRMIIPLGSPSSVQDLVLVIKKKDKVVVRELFPVRFVPFTREEE